MEKREQLENTPKVYEIGYLLVPSIAEEQVAGNVQEIKAVLEKFETSYITEDFPKLQPLAYTMVKNVGGGIRHKHDKAYFGWIKFETMASHIPQIKAELDKNLNLLRYMIINTVRESTMFSPKIAFKSEDPAVDAPKDADKPKVSEEELDKTIDSLVV